MGEIDVADLEVADVQVVLGIADRVHVPPAGRTTLFDVLMHFVSGQVPGHEELSHARADDFPPYIAIFIVGHVLVGWMLHAEMSGPVDPMFYVWTMIPMAVLLPLALLPSIKGAVVGLQWANYMHGFDPTHPDPAAPDIV